MLGSNGAAKYNTFLAMINFAGQAGKECLSAITPECEGIEGKLAEWGTDVAKARALYTAVYTAMETHGDSDGAHSFRRKFLLTFQGGKDVSGAKKEAAAVVIEAIANPVSLVTIYPML